MDAAPAEVAPPVATPRHGPLSRKGGVRLAMYALGLAAYLIGKDIGCSTAELVTLAGMLTVAVGGDTYRPSGMSG